jgi:phage terminase small subunit
MSKAMKPAHAKFVDEYFLCGLNAAEAYRRAFGRDVKGAKQSALRLLQREDVRAAITARLKESAMEADEALARLSEWGRGSIAPFLATNQDGLVRLDLNSDEAAESLHLIKKLKQVRTRKGGGDKPWEEERTEIELHDAKDAVVQLAKIRGLFVERHAGPDGGPLQISVVGPHHPVDR